jgi:hypothetical protein
MRYRLLSVGLSLLALPLVGAAGDDSLAELAASLKPLLASSVPPVLYEKSTNWGHQELAANGLRWHGLHAEVVKTPKNDGKWRKVRLTTQDLPRTLVINLTDFKAVDDDRQTFKVLLAFQAGVEYEQQNWDLGVRLWSGSVRARMQLKLALECESVLRVNTGKGLLPDLVFRLRVTKADISYDNLVVEHIAGVGGSAARLIGEAVHGTLKHCKPSLERELLARADATIVKAADTREVRLGLSGLVKKK